MQFQVLRQNKQLPQMMTSQHAVPTITKRSSLPVTSYSLGSKNDFVAVKKHSSMIETSSLSKKSLRKERLPGSSWLKNSSRVTNEIVLGAPVSKANKKKRENLPGSGWLLSKSYESPRKGMLNLIKHFKEKYVRYCTVLGRVFVYFLEK